MINLYNRDCMEAMREAPDNYWDLAICDPPYGINIAKWDKKIPSKEYFYLLERVSRNQIIFGINNFWNCPLKNVGRIIWNKLGTHTEKRHQLNCMSDCEIAYQSFDKLLKMFNYTYIGNVIGNNYKIDWDHKKTRIHPTQKPIALYEWLLSKYAKKGDKILDTHLGSGSSAIAAHRMGFSFDGYEIDKDYFDGAKARLEQEQRQLLLFG